MHDSQDHPERSSDSGRQAGDYVGYGSPPQSGRFSPGASGNPAGRPRRRPMTQPIRGRVITAEPTEMERALAEPVVCLMVDASAPTSLARAVIGRLTERALERGDISACRELLRLCAEAEAMGAERELLAAERDEAEREAAQAAEEAAAARAREARRQAQEAAELELELMARQAADDAGESDLDDVDRALKLLDAGEVEDGQLVRLKPWVFDAARAHDPRLPRAGDVRPLNLDDPQGALDRLELGLENKEGDIVLTAWFVEAARARRPEAWFARGDEALLARMGMDDGEADWVARLAAVKELAP